MTMHRKMAETWIPLYEEIKAIQKHAREQEMQSVQSGL